MPEHGEEMHVASSIFPNHPGPRRETREQELLAMYGQLTDATEVLNERALMVMRRMSDKLTGRDFVAVRVLAAAGCMPAANGTCRMLLNGPAGSAGVHAQTQRCLAMANPGSQRACWLSVVGSVHGRGDM